MSSATRPGSGAPAAAPPEAALEASIFGRMPILLGEREYGVAGAHATCFAFAVATWCFLVGGYAAQLVGAVQGAVCLLAGSMIGVFLAGMPLSLACQRYGLEQIDFCKPAFGQRGARAILVFYLINMLGWSGLILVMLGNGIRNLLAALGQDPGGWSVGAGAALGIVACYWIVTRGVHLLNLANAIITPGLVVIVAFMLWVLLREHGWEAIAAAPPLDPGPRPTLNYLIALELGVANGISWWGGIGFIARNTRTRRSSVYPELLQLGLAGGIVSCIALFSALIVQSEDPTEWMVPIGGVWMGVAALLFVALANVTSVAVSVYASGLAMRHVPAFRSLSWRRLVALVMLPCLPFAFWPTQLYDLGDVFLAYNGTMYAPISGILFADYFLLRRRRLCLWSIFDDHPDGEYHYSRGFHWRALGCLVLGQITYLSLYNPMSGETHPFFEILPASLAAFTLPALVYAIVARVGSPRALRAPDAAARRLIAPNI
jgi:NCS1 family nucleobase:cation symporter-1